MEIKPVYFITPNSEVQIKYKDEKDEYVYYSGLVKCVNNYGTDEIGSYVNCSIDFDDGESVPESLLYNKDFENINSDETWKFKSNISLLVKYVVEHNKEMLRIFETESESEPEPDQVSEIEQVSEQEQVSDTVITAANFSFNVFYFLTCITIPIIYFHYYLDNFYKL
jgi:hypothetical protein